MRLPRLSRWTLIVFAPVLLSAGLLRVQSGERPDRLDSTLRMLAALRGHSGLPESLQGHLKGSRIPVTIRFQRGAQPRSEDRAHLAEALGVDWSSAPVSLDRVHAVEVPWESVARLADWPGIERVDSVWKPAVAGALDLSAPEVGADAAWAMVDAAGRPIIGEGITVALFDTGIDVYHPDFWRDDGATYGWLDVNHNGTLDPGIDCIDLNANGEADSGELLRLVRATSEAGDEVPGTVHAGYVPSVDWLYIDANNNAQRDVGASAGFTETHSAFGETILLGRDLNHDSTIGISETLVALGSSKVQAVLGASGIEYRRGVNLIDSPSDRSGHGTQAASIVAGGQVGLRRYVGIAPGASLLVADCWTNEPSVYIPWAERNGARVMLYEFGSWVQEFLDGSSNLEQMLDAESARGIVQVAPAGNLANGAKHAHLVLGTAGSHQVRLMVPLGQPTTQVWVSILWHRWDSGLRVELVSPGGSVVQLPGNDTVTPLAGHIVISSRDHSPRDTVRFDIGLFGDGTPVDAGIWTLRLTNRLSYGLNVNLYLTDQDRNWEGGVVFMDSVDAFYTVTSPATADSAIAVASYSTRGRGGDPVGVRSQFSGVGPRLDGEPAIALAAPGHFADVATASSRSVEGGSFGQYRWFGGTSAAAAHVAGAVALVRQAYPYLRPEAVGEWLRNSARADLQTGVVPNERWGSGKLDVAAALGAIPTPTATPAARLHLPLVLRKRP